VVVFVAPGPGSAAFVAGRRIGGAVLRNRARRILRAAWRELEDKVEDGTDVVMVARVAIVGSRTQDLVAEVEELLSRAQVIVT
jgi:ribonuclease P protein component